MPEKLTDLQTSVAVALAAVLDATHVAIALGIRPDGRTLGLLGNAELTLRTLHEELAQVRTGPLAERR